MRPRQASASQEPSKRRGLAVPAPSDAPRTPKRSQQQRQQPVPANELSDGDLMPKPSTAWLEQTPARYQHNTKSSTARLHSKGVLTAESGAVADPVVAPSVSVQARVERPAAPEATITNLAKSTAQALREKSYRQAGLLPVHAQPEPQRKFGGWMKRPGTSDTRKSRSPSPGTRLSGTRSAAAGGANAASLFHTKAWTAQATVAKPVTPPPTTPFTTAVPSSRVPWEPPTRPRREPVVQDPSLTKSFAVVNQYHPLLTRARSTTPQRRRSASESRVPKAVSSSGGGRGVTWAPLDSEPEPEPEPERGERHDEALGFQDTTKSQQLNSVIAQLTYTLAQQQQAQAQLHATVQRSVVNHAVSVLKNRAPAQVLPVTVRRRVPAPPLVPVTATPASQHQ